jgi:mono/diheme cytochrome c family protein
VLGSLGVLGCSWDGTWAEPTPTLHRMLEQPRYDSYESSAFFDDRMAMRVPPEGTVPFGASEREAPPPLDHSLLARGHDRYDVFCAPCHGEDGYAETPIAADMVLRPPPSLQQAYVRARSDEYLHGVIRDGYGLMPSYAARLTEPDRWAVVAYVRALQLSQHVPIAWLPPGYQGVIRGSP